jgi:hypothetical protein
LVVDILKSRAAGDKQDKADGSPEKEPPQAALSTHPRVLPSVARVTSAKDKLPPP